MDDAWIDHRFRAVDRQDPLKRVHAWLHGESDERPVVCDGKHPFALINVHAILGHRVREDTRIDDVARPVPCLEPTDDRDQALRKFLDASTTYLPIRQGQPPRLLGIVDAVHVLAAFEDGPSAGVACAPVDPLRSTDTIDHAATCFGQTSAERLAVVDGRGRVLGALPRPMTIRVQSSFQQGMERMDKVGNSRDLGDEAVTGYLEDRWCQLPAGAEYRECVEHVRQHGTCFVTDRGAYKGILDAVGLMQALGAPSQESGMPGHFRQPKALPPTR